MASKKTAAKTPKKTSSIDFDELKSVLDLMDQHGLAEFQWEQGGTRLSLKNRHAFPAQVVAATASAARSETVATQQSTTLLPPATGASASPTAHASAPKPAQAANQKQVLSPFVGTFYRSPAPGKDSYVREGQTVKPGDVLCIVEAMKLMNEIEAEFGGKIVSILVDNGQPVEFGEPLFLVET